MAGRTRLVCSIVDAFAEVPYRGNAAGVVLDADELTDEQMQLIAREINASETAFLSRLNDLHRAPRLRWFTPTTEVRFCGHATLAAAHALFDQGRLVNEMSAPDVTLQFETAVGELRVVPEWLPEPYDRPMWWLSVPSPGIQPAPINPVRTCQLLGISDRALDDGFPFVRTTENDLIVMVEQYQTLLDVQPDFRELGRWCERHELRGICVATTNTLAESIDVQCRFFAPVVGVNEDPVTGSLHGPLAVYLVVNEHVGRSGNRAAVNSAQGVPGGRAGLVRVLVEGTSRGYQAAVGGVCFTTFSGQMVVPGIT